MILSVCLKQCLFDRFYYFYLRNRHLIIQIKNEIIFFFLFYILIICSEFIEQLKKEIKGEPSKVNAFYLKNNIFLSYCKGGGGGKINQ